jgi:peptide/nickel transport system permease protein
MPNKATRKSSQLRDFVQMHKVASAGAFFIVVLISVSLFAPLPFDPEMPNPGVGISSPSASHWFGTDITGGDVFSRTIAAAWIDLSLALAGTLLSLLIGVPLGLATSVKRRWSDNLVRGMDAFQAFPLLILALVLVSLSGNKLYMVVVAIALINIPRYMRLIRSEVLSLRESRFMEASHAVGVPLPRNLRKHVLPNVMGIITAQTTLTMANAIVVIATLSFLGIGVVPPTPSWGSMIRSGSSNMISGEWWVAIFPGLFILLCVLIFNQLSDAISDFNTRTTR